MVIGPADPFFAACTRNGFARQQVMPLLAASMVRAEAGEVDILLPHWPEPTWQHDCFHVGIVADIAEAG